MRDLIGLLAFALIAATASVAHAYPQYQLSRDQTCGSCHTSQAGGGLLNDNGELTAGDEATWGGDPSFLHGLVTPPEWLELGGDVRFAGGVNDPGGGIGGAGFPMQGELYAQATRGALAVVADLGLTSPKSGGSPLTVLMSREHYLRWSQRDDGLGFYGRIGRFMPVYGLRLAEHNLYTQRYGATSLYGESYGASIGWTAFGAEAHVTAFVADRLRLGIGQGDGAAAYVEKRFGKVAVGAEAAYTHAPDNVRTEGGLTGKLWLDGANLLLSGEVQGVHQTFDTGPARDQVVGQLLASWFPAHGYLVDVGLGHYDEDVTVPKVERDAVDLNVHWFPTSHLELLLMGRVQAIGLGSGGAGSGYGLLQFHYRI